MLFWICRVKTRRGPKSPRLFSFQPCPGPLRADALQRRAPSSSRQSLSRQSAPAPSPPANANSTPSAAENSPNSSSSCRTPSVKLAWTTLPSLGYVMPCHAIQISQSKRAHDHHIKLTFEILVHKDLPVLRFESQFGHNLEEKGLVEDPHDSQVYRRFATTMPDIKIEGTQNFEVRIERAVRV
jgi:hypothetical protein